MLGLVPAAAQTDDALPPNLQGRTDPSDCFVVRVESKAFVTVHCATIEGMHAYGKYCCETRGGFEFSTYSRWYIAEHSKPIDAPSLSAPMSADEALKIAQRYDNAIPRDIPHARDWYEKAANAGSFYAMKEVLDIYRYDGEELGLDKKAAASKYAYWTERARAHANASQDADELQYVRDALPPPAATIQSNARALKIWPSLLYGTWTGTVCGQSATFSFKPGILKQTISDRYSSTSTTSEVIWIRSKTLRNGKVRYDRYWMSPSPAAFGVHAQDVHDKVQFNADYDTPSGTISGIYFAPGWVCQDVSIRKKSSKLDPELQGLGDLEFEHLFDHI